MPRHTSLTSAILLNSRSSNLGDNTVKSGLVFYVNAAATTSYSGSGASWNDISGSGLNLTAGGGFPTFSGGNSFIFNGSNQFIQSTAVGPATNITNNLTIEAWINMAAWQDYGSIIVLGTGSGEQWSLNSQNSKRDGSGTANGLSFGSNWPGTWYMVSPTAAVTINRWYCIHLTYSSNTVTWYINGSYNSSVSLGVNPLTAVAGAYIAVGANIPGGIEYFNGKIGIVKVYNRVLSTGEISQNFLAHRVTYGI
jgi:hypothetical protein